jgi:hypothetical protein
MRKKWISRRNEGWALWDLNPRPPACRDESSGARAVARSTSKSTPSRLSRIGLGVLTLGACALMPGCFFDNPSMASAKSWGSSKAPKNPTMDDVRGAASPYEMAMLRKTARCEQPGDGMWGVRWDTPGHWRFVGGYGMYRGTYSAGAQIAGVRRFPPQATPAEQSFVALAVARKWGWSAWDCN